MAQHRDDFAFDIEEMQELREDDGLSDLKLGEIDDEESGKKRRILIISAGLLIIFLVMLVATKAVNSDDEKETTGYLLPPEPIVEDKSGRGLFKDVEVETEPKEAEVVEEGDRAEFSQIIEDLKNKERVEETTELSNDEKLEKMQEIIQPKKQIEKIKPKAIKEEIKRVTQPKIAPKRKVFYPSGKFFVQVGATSKAKPDAVFLGKLKSNNLEFRTLEVAVNGMVVNKILVGPYEEKAQALKELPTIRRYIARDAFIYRAK